MKTTKHYDITTKHREALDREAIQDIKNYLSEKQWYTLLALAKVTKRFDNILIGLDFCGVSGYPVHAFGRAYCLSLYRDWMLLASPPIPTDQFGFRLHPEVPND